MNAFTTRRGLPFADPLDALLADVAIRIQLSPTDHRKAVARYRADQRVDRTRWEPSGRPRDRFYPQGSMAIGAAIASKTTNDEFDLDVVAELDLPLRTTPREVLDLLFLAVNGQPGSRYHGKVRRRTRCVTVEYADNMHIDVTPALRRPGTPERESLIFHHRAEAPAELSFRCVANRYGFAEWFKQATPPDHWFAEAFMARTLTYERALLVKRQRASPYHRRNPRSRSRWPLLRSNW